MKLFSRIAALTVSALLVVGGASAAQAAPADLINPDAPVTLNIIKYVGEAGQTDQTLQGAQFLVQRLSVDLTTAAGWETLSETPASALADTDPTNNNGIAVTDVTTLTTDVNGRASIGSPAINVGAYLVSEQQFGSYSVAAPFIVTLPWSDDTTGAWNYTQTVQPKNQSIKPTKSVVDNTAVPGVATQYATIGGTLHYTINAPVQAGPLNEFVITDDLPAELQLVNPIRSLAAAGADLVAGTDYTVSYNAGDVLVITFTRSGMDKLSAARVRNAAMQVVVSFDATVRSIPTDFTIENTATVRVNGAGLNTDIQIDDVATPASTTYATMTITKTGENNAPLAGGTFEVYECTQAAADQPWVLQGEAVQIASDPTGNPGTAFVTGADGTVSGYGIPVRSFSTVPDAPEVTHQWCVIETKAPSGYLRNPEIIPLDHDQNAHALTATVPNQKDTLLGQLPATGAWGLLIVLIVGGGLVARGVVTSRRESRA